MFFLRINNNWFESENKILTPQKGQKFKIQRQSALFHIFTNPTEILIRDVSKSLMEGSDADEPLVCFDWHPMRTSIRKSDSKNLSSILDFRRISSRWLNLTKPEKLKIYFAQNSKVFYSHTLVFYPLQDKMKILELKPNFGICHRMILDFGEHRFFSRHHFWEIPVNPLETAVETSKHHFWEVALNPLETAVDTSKHHFWEVLLNRSESVLETSKHHFCLVVVNPLETLLGTSKLEKKCRQNPHGFLS